MGDTINRAITSFTYPDSLQTDHFIDGMTAEAAEKSHIGRKVAAFGTMSKCVHTLLSFHNCLL